MTAGRSGSGDGDGAAPPAAGAPGSTVEPWKAQRVVDAELARALIREQFPAFAARVEPFGSGWDNTAYLVDGYAVFRFPRRQVAVELVETEARVLPVLAPRLPIPVPVPEWVGEPTERFPWPFAGYRRLPGRTADGFELGDEDRAALAPVLGRFLAALHATPAAGLQLAGDTIARTDFASRMPATLERAEALRAAGVLPDPSPWLRLFDDELPEPAARSVPCHGDLYERHVLLDDSRRVSGVIDWGDVHLGDPGIDLNLLYRFFPARMRPTFLAAYGPVDERTLRMARLRAAYHVLVSALFAHSTADAPLLRSSLTGLQFILED